MFAGVAVGRPLTDMQVDLRFDPSAIGAEAFRLQLGKLAADPADLFRYLSSSVEEAQTYIGHDGPSSENVGEKSAESADDPDVVG